MTIQVISATMYKIKNTNNSHSELHNISVLCRQNRICCSMSPNSMVFNSFEGTGI